MRISDLGELSITPTIKIGLKEKYSLISFYDSKDNLQFAIQINDGTEDAVKLWLKYLGILVNDQGWFERVVIPYWEMLFCDIKPLPGDPLISMEIVGSNESNHGDNTGGMYGCVRFSINNCESKTNDLLISAPKIDERQQFHSGVDLKASVNTDLYSMFEGEVVLADFNLVPDQCSSTNKAGNVIIIKSENINGKTIFAYYCHLNEKVDFVKVGYTVKQGEKIGKTGNACGISDWRDHVHIIIYESSINSIDKVNPIDYFNTKFDKSNGNKIN